IVSEASILGATNAHLEGGGYHTGDLIGDRHGRLSVRRERLHPDIGYRGGYRLDLVDHAGCGSAGEAARRVKVGDEQGVTGRQQTVKVPNVRLVVADEVEIAAGRQVGEDQRILLVRDPTQAALAMKADEYAVVEPSREPRGGHRDLGRALALRPVRTGNG